MRPVGALLLVLAFFLAAAGSLREKKERLRCLRDICLALQLLRGEMECRSAPFSETIEVLLPQLKGAGKSLFLFLSQSLSCLGEASFSELWEQAAAQSCQVLREEERQQLSRLGLVLGRYELEAQLRELAACHALLQSREREAAENYPVQRRLQLGLALSSGAVLAILLL